MSLIICEFCKKNFKNINLHLTKNKECNKKVKPNKKQVIILEDDDISDIDEELANELTIKCCKSGDWCRGCGGLDKLKNLKEVGYNDLEADEIYELQFGECGKFCPCPICKKLDFHNWVINNKK